MSSTLASPPAIRPLPSRDLHFSTDSLAIYGDPTDETDGLLESIRAEGVLVPLVVARVGSGWEVVSGHRRLACALALGWRKSRAKSANSRPGPRAGSRSSNITVNAARRSAR